MKRTMYFNTQQDVINYYGSLDNIPSLDLVIVKEDGGIYARSNNEPGNTGETISMGGEPISDEDKELVDNTLYGEEPETEPEEENTNTTEE